MFSSSSPGNFLDGKQLTPKDVYLASIGAFENEGYTCDSAIFDSDSSEEIARVYKKDGKLFILYYPGKDNDEPRCHSDPTEPLKDIVEKADKQLSCAYTPTQINGSRKMFIVAESNVYLGVKVQHFIKADLNAGELTTEDSMNRAYDETYVTQLLNHEERKTVKRGWQQLFDTWQCGHFVIAAIHREIRGEEPPKSFVITQNILKLHSELFEKGREIFLNSKQNKFAQSEEQAAPLIDEIDSAFFETSAVDDEAGYQQALQELETILNTQPMQESTENQEKESDVFLVTGKIAQASCGKKPETAKIRNDMSDDQDSGNFFSDEKPRQCKEGQDPSPTLSSSQKKTGKNLLQAIKTARASPNFNSQDICILTRCLKSTTKLIVGEKNNPLASNAFAEHQKNIKEIHKLNRPWRTMVVGALICVAAAAVLVSTIALTVITAGAASPLAAIALPISAKLAIIAGAAISGSSALALTKLSIFTHRAVTYKSNIEIAMNQVKGSLQKK